jgi:phenylpropionate dioxygenase-like ring-hydroxylating dioxygenase large terminal subunit
MTQLAGNAVQPIVQWPSEGYRRAPYRVYDDPRVYEREQERIFRGPVWHFLALEAEMPDPGDFKTTYVGDTPIVVTRDPDGTVHAFVNRCAHRGSLVCLEASGKKRSGFTCVYHAWSYDLEGNLTSAAFRRGLRGQGGLPADFQLSEHGLQKLRAESYCGVIFGTLSQDAQPLQDYLGAEARTGIQRAMRRPLCILGYDSQIINANWKTYHENTRDTFHANILHVFFGTFGASRHSQEAAVVQDPRGLHFYVYTKRGTEVESADYNNTAASLRSVKSDFKLNDASVIDWKDEFGDGCSVHITTMFPTFVIHQVQHSLGVRQLIPKGPGRCELIFTYFGYADDSPEMTQTRLKHINATGSAGLVSMEDGAVCEFVMKGTAGSGGAASFMEMGGKDLEAGGDTKLSEKPLRHFWNNYRKLMDL